MICPVPSFSVIFLLTFTLFCFLHFSQPLFCLPLLFHLPFLWVLYMFPCLIILLSHCSCNTVQTPEGPSQLALKVKMGKLCKGRKGTPVGCRVSSSFLIFHVMPVASQFCCLSPVCLCLMYALADCSWVAGYNPLAKIKHGIGLCWVIQWRSKMGVPTVRATEDSMGCMGSVLQLPPYSWETGSPPATWHTPVALGGLWFWRGTCALVYSFQQSTTPEHCLEPAHSAWVTPAT